MSLPVYLEAIELCHRHNVIITEAFPYLFSVSGGYRALSSPQRHHDRRTL